MTVRQVDAAEAVALVAGGYRAVDVREPGEWASGHVAGAELVPLAELADRIGEVAPEPTTPLLLYCASGARSGRGAARLAQMGYAHVANLNAPITDWPASGGAWEGPADGLSPGERHRYGRHLLLPEVGAAGQRRLLDARLLLVGAGGLGSPAALYLAASGVGTLGIVDDDVVDESNLQRQVLHTGERIGLPKVESAEQTIRALNSDTRVVKHRERLTSDNAERLVAAYDLVIDGTDNLDTRYALNDASVRLGKPMVHGSVYRWDGQVTTIVPGKGPCYRCIHPVQPPDALVRDCDVAGVLGVLPGIVGTLQAAEAIKLVLGVGEPLIGRLLLVDALRGTTEELSIPRDPSCPACGVPARSLARASA